MEVEYLLEKVKVALRISHDKLNDEIQDTINTAKKELERAGILSSMILDTDPLIVDAVKTFCKYSFASNDKMREGFFESWQYQLDCLRKTGIYYIEVVE